MLLPPRTCVRNTTEAMRQRHLRRRERVNLGSYYTPRECVEIAESLLMPHIARDTVLLDSASGYGSFLGNPLAETIIGADIDPHAVAEAARLRPEAAVLRRNALVDVCRKSYGISESRRLAVVGNPPYNDRTSQIRRGIKQDFGEMDEGLCKRDLGLSFLTSYARLRADVVCVLHPLSYLIKKANFRLLKEFSNAYELRDGVMISSAVFEENSGSTHFPILVALYARSSRGMSCETVAQFPFRTMDGRLLRLADYDFLPKYVRKYPERNAVVAHDSLFFYPLRDINALKRNRTFVRGYRPDMIVVDKTKLDYYIYIDVFKRNLHRLPWYYGNCDVFIDRPLFMEYRSAFVSDAVEHHPFLEAHVGKPTASGLEVGGYFDALLSEKRNALRQ